MTADLVPIASTDTPCLLDSSDALAKTKGGSVGLFPPPRWRSPMSVPNSCYEVRSTCNQWSAIVGPPYEYQYKYEYPYGDQHGFCPAATMIITIILIYVVCTPYVVVCSTPP
jgi:hypothetical protein